MGPLLNCAQILLVGRQGHSARSDPGSSFLLLPMRSDNIAVCLSLRSTAVIKHWPQPSR